MVFLYNYRRSQCEMAHMMVQIVLPYQIHRRTYDELDPLSSYTSRRGIVRSNYFHIFYLDERSLRRSRSLTPLSNYPPRKPHYTTSLLRQNYFRRKKWQLYFTTGE